MDMHDDDAPDGREIDCRFARLYTNCLVDTLSVCARRDGASMEAVYLTLICAAVCVSQRHNLQNRVAAVLAILDSGNFTFPENTRAN